MGGGDEEREHSLPFFHQSKGSEKREMPGEKRHGSEFKRSALDGSEEQKDVSRDHLEDSDSFSDINRDGHWGKGVRKKRKKKRGKSENIKSEKQLRLFRRAVIRLKKALNG